MKFSKFFGISILVFFVLFSETLFAVPAIPKPLVKRQPDGSVLTILLKGDERKQWAESTDGYTLLKRKAGGWEYAIRDSLGDLHPSGMLAKEVARRSINETQWLTRVPKKLNYSKAQSIKFDSIWNQHSPSNDLIRTGQFFKKNSSSLVSKSNVQKAFTPKGGKKLLMILIQFPDRPFYFSKQHFYDLMNQENYSLGGAQGSVRDYFLETSYLQFDLHTDVAGIYTANNPLNYYGENDHEDNDTLASELIQEAIAKANADIDFSQYDNDGDGEVDGVYVIYSGYGEATSGIDNTIWPHASSIQPAQYDGVKVSKYSCSNELNYHSTAEGLPDETRKEVTTIGVICHEFGHVCGAPDYYDTNYNTDGEFTGTGRWDLMDMGLYNGDLIGSQPAHINPFEKIQAGWVQPITLTNPTTLSLLDITEYPQVYQYMTATPGEYFLMENRQQNGFNTDCPGHGLMIYHFSSTYWNEHANKTKPQGFYPVCASAVTSPTILSDEVEYGLINSAGCPFPGSTGIVTFTDETVPSARAWNGSVTQAPLISINETNETIQLIFKSKPLVNPNLLLETIPINSTVIGLAWTANSDNDSVLIASSITPIFGQPDNGQTYQVGDAIPGGGTVLYSGSYFMAMHSGLTPSTSYYYSIWSVNDLLQYSDGLTAQSKTTDLSVAVNPFVEGFESSVLPTTWTQVYEGDSLDWLIKTRGVNGHPNTAHNGRNFLRFNDLTWGNFKTKLITPPLDLSGSSSAVLKFWHTQENWDGRQDKFRVYYRKSVSGDWNLLAIYNQSIANWTQETLTLPDPTGTYYIAFEGNTGVGYGVCLDDIEITKNPVSGLKPIESDNVVVSQQNRGFALLQTNGIITGATATVRTLTGQTVLSFKLSNPSTTIGPLPAGVYLLEIKDPSKTLNKKLLIR